MHYNGRGTKGDFTYLFHKGIDGNFSHTLFNECANLEYVFINVQFNWATNRIYTYSRYISIN